MIASSASGMFLLPLEWLQQLELQVIEPGMHLDTCGLLEQRKSIRASRHPIWALCSVSKHPWYPGPVSHKALPLNIEGTRWTCIPDLYCILEQDQRLGLRRRMPLDTLQETQVYLNTTRQ